MTPNTENIAYDLSLSKVNAGKVPVALTDLYIEAFPADERRPVAAWLRLLSSGAFDAYSIIYKGAFAGFITLWRLGGFCYVEHFAISPALRGSGVGSAALRTIDSIAGGVPVVLEVEPSYCGAMAQRRIRFYRRNDFVDFPRFRYIQPPYSTDTKSVELMLMVKNYRPQGPSVASMAQRIRKEVYFI